MMTSKVYAAIKIECLKLQVSIRNFNPARHIRVMSCCVCLAALLASSAVLSASENPDEGDQGGPDIDTLIDGIPSASLEEGVVLQSGEIKILLSDVETVEKANIAAQKKRNPDFAVTDEMRGYLRKHVAFQYFVNSIVDKYVLENKLVPNPEKLEEQILSFKESRIKEGTDFGQWLSENGLNEEQFRHVLGANLAIEQKLASTITTDELSASFEKVKDQVPPRRASHILFMYKGLQSSPESITRSKEDAKTSADATLKKLKEGADFAEQAKACSDCPSKDKGGDLDFFPRQGAMVEPFAEAAYKLEKVGDITDVVETPFGYHIIKLTDLRTQDQLKDIVKQQMTQEKVGRQMQQLILESAAVAKFNQALVMKPKMEPDKK